MQGPRYIVQPCERNQPGKAGFAWVIDSQRTGDWGEPLRVFLVTPASAAQAHCDRLNTAHPQETDPIPEGGGL
jgi:hypothetical protein